MSIADIKKNSEQKMQKSVDSFKNELAKIRTRRTHPRHHGRWKSSMRLDGSYQPGGQCDLAGRPNYQCSAVGKGLGPKIEKAIRESDLGFESCYTQGDLIRVPMPP